MDAFARGLKIAAAIRADGRLDEFVQQRYAGWGEGLGADIEAGRVDLAALAETALQRGEVDDLKSGRVEMLENLINEYI
jgi:xylose isomerase